MKIFRFFLKKTLRRVCILQQPKAVLFIVKQSTVTEIIFSSEKKHEVRIPMISEARSLNLSNSVAIIVYEALRQTGYNQLKTDGKFAELL